MTHYILGILFVSRADLPNFLLSPSQTRGDVTFERKYYQPFYTSIIIERLANTHSHVCDARSNANLVEERSRNSPILLLLLVANHPGDRSLLCQALS
jgi:hypothetical protein